MGRRAGRRRQPREGLFVVEEAERGMNTESQNATLLKMLGGAAGAGRADHLADRDAGVAAADDPVAVPVGAVRAAGVGSRWSAGDDARARDRGKAEVAQEATALSEGSPGAAMRYVDDGLLPIAKELDQRITWPR